MINIEQIFTIVTPKMIDKKDTEESHSSEKVPFIGRSSKNNGVTGYVKPIKNFINEGGVLTISLDGSTGSVFYQKKDFMSGQNIWILQPKFSLNKDFIGIYFATLIEETVKDYSYNLGLTKSRLKKINLDIPILKEGEIDWEKINSYNYEKQNVNNFSIYNNKFTIDNKYFKNINYKKVKDLKLTVSRINTKIPIYALKENFTKYKTKENTIPYFSASKVNNLYGIVGWVSEKNINIKKVSGEYLLVNNNGSIGYVRYYKGHFIGTSDVSIIDISTLTEKLDSEQKDYYIPFITSYLEGQISKIGLKYNIKLSNDLLSNLELPYFNIFNV